MILEGYGELYGDIPQITTKIKARRLTFAGHCKRAEGFIVSKLVTWRPTQGARSKGRPKKTYVDLLEDDTGYAVNEVENSMKDRHLWRAIINAQQQESTEWVSECWRGTTSSCECNKVVSVFWSFCRRCLSVFKFLLPFIVFKRPFSFIKIELLWLQTWIFILNWVFCWFKNTQLKIKIFNWVFLNQQKIQFCPNVSWDLVAFTWHRLRQLGCPIAQGNHFLVQATMINIIFARPGKYKSEVSLHQSYQSSYKHQKSYLNWVQTIDIQWLFNFTHTVFLFGHVWASSFIAKLAQPGNQEERKLSQPDMTNWHWWTSHLVNY